MTVWSGGDDGFAPDPDAEPPNMQMLEEVEYLRTTALAIEQGSADSAPLVRLIHKYQGYAPWFEDIARESWTEALRFAADHLELTAWPDGPPTTEEEST